MQFLSERWPLQKLMFLPAVLFATLFLPVAARSQDSAGDFNLRGNRAEVSLTVRDNSGEPVPVPASVKLLRDGVQIAQANTARGRAYFVLPSFGDYTLVVEASGYKVAQKEVSARMAVRLEVDINLQKDSDSGNTPGVSSGPLLAPKAKEALDKGLQALLEGKLSDARTYIDEASKLAPSHPEVLYVQGVLDLKEHKWPEAQTVLEKATQVDPNNARAFSALGMAVFNQKKYNDAIAPLEKSLQIDAAGSWETQWSLAEAYYHVGQYDNALKHAQEARNKANGGVPQVELMLAKSLTSVGRYEDAAQILRDFLKNHPDDKEAPTARRWLDGLKSNGKIH